MPRINTNVAALNAQRNTMGTENSLRTSLERLSSGLRINRAADDAAGLSISEKLRGQVRGLNQAVANSQDAIALIGTAEGAMNESTAILQRMRELAVQSSNDTNTDLDRQAIQDEVTALKSELTRIAGTTQYNGKNLLDGSFNGTFQIGANAGQTVSKGIDSMASVDIGRATFAGNAGEASTTAVSSTALAANVNLANSGFSASTLTVNGPLNSKDITVAAASQASTVAAQINSTSGATGVSAYAVTEVVSGAVASTTANFAIITSTGRATINVNVQANDADGALTAAINAQSAKTGVTASLEDGAITLKSDKGETITLRDLDSTARDGRAPLNLGLTNDSDRNIGGKVYFESAKAFSVTSSAVATGTVVTGTVDSTLESVADISLSNRDDAADAIRVIDKAIEAVSRNRSGLGALQNRLQSTINNLSVSSENLANAESRIRDVDFATEVVAMTRSQILQQSGTSILAQANQLPQSALSLLR